MENQNSQLPVEEGSQKVVEFHPLEAVEKALRLLKSRDRSVLKERFGLEGEKRATLEEIGKRLGVTRERIRQLEKAALKRLRESRKEKLQALTEPLVNHLRKQGGAASLEELAGYFNLQEEKDKRALALLANLAPDLVPLSFADACREAWGIREAPWEQAGETVEKAKEIFRKGGKLLKFDSFWQKFKESESLEKRVGSVSPEWVRAVLATSQVFGRSGDLWGLSVWPTVTPKRIRDKIYLVLKRGGHPLHFRQIAIEVARQFPSDKKVLSRTVHNELIGDKRFVLIGRGIYALKEWGYQPGVVADVITDILRKAGKPLTTKEIVAEALKQRAVKKNTIIANLQNRKLFRKVAKATYTLVEGRS